MVSQINNLKKDLKFYGFFTLRICFESMIFALFDKPSSIDEIILIFSLWVSCILGHIIFEDQHWTDIGNLLPLKKVVN